MITQGEIQMTESEYQEMKAIEKHEEERWEKDITSWTLTKILMGMLYRGDMVTKGSFYLETKEHGSATFTLAQRIYDVKKTLPANERIMSRRVKNGNWNEYWLERIKTRTLDEIIWEKV
tara:strand:- start:19 stop:375 length:357 start_codon:yes stop_codon:yes gene_type:complete